MDADATRRKIEVQKFSFEKTDIEGLILVNSFFVEDERGWFLKSFEKGIFQQQGIDIDVYEDFESYSKKGVIRGLHFQEKEPQAKLVRTISGEIFDVAVDLRTNSPTHGEWRGVYLSGENKKSLFIPKGFAHGFLVLSEYALVSYKCEGKFLPHADSGLIWNDIDIKVEWPLDKIEKLTISEKDEKLQTFSQYCKRITAGGLK